MIEILHYLKDPKLWDYGIFLLIGTAGFRSSTVGGSGLSLVRAPRIICGFRAFAIGLGDSWSLYLGFRV